VASYKRAMDRAPAKHPLCPNCGEPMRLARVIAGTSALAPINVYECMACGVYYSEASREPAAPPNKGSAHC